MKDACIQLQKVNKFFGLQHIVKDLQLDVYKGEFLTLLGPSGCGKTTTLRMIAGFEYPSSGEVWLNGQNVTDLSPNKRDVNTVFQNYALFPHLNVIENIGYGLKMKRVAKTEIQRRVNDALAMVQMDRFATRKPRDLSGGQQQRVAVARAIVNNPTVLLLDEPLGALDLKLRKQMQLELKHLQQKLGMTFVYVTHDQEEALTMSDRVAVMKNGQIEQVGSPRQIYNDPQTMFVADFIGETNLLPGSLLADQPDHLDILIEGVPFSFPRKKQITYPKEVFISIRPEFIRFGKKRPEGHRCLIGRISERVFVGSLIKTIITIPTGTRIVITESAAVNEWINEGEEVYLFWDNQKAVVLAS